jgi:hypothetical protein
MFMDCGKKNRIGEEMHFRVVPYGKCGMWIVHELNRRLDTSPVTKIVHTNGKWWNI